ncbi:hypothetical protein LptCag_0380 [Leptospirillum ferriphilum]|uniref:Uncharacterized protein n=1 Tax=Leptospirillum ferriphilum TaxID=178606 RepID=A0A094X444_9BACT|nr:hypothetical protein LptCag_0380 [Leptospirillum ferriphilum]
MKQFLSRSRKQIVIVPESAPLAPSLLIKLGNGIPGDPHEDKEG